MLFGSSAVSLVYYQSCLDLQQLRMRDDTKLQLQTGDKHGDYNVCCNEELLSRHTLTCCWYEFKKATQSCFGFLKTCSHRRKGIKLHAAKSSVLNVNFYLFICGETDLNESWLCWFSTKPHVLDKSLSELVMCL